jgi:hypothetical protein
MKTLLIIAFWICCSGYAQSDTVYYKGDLDNLKVLYESIEPNERMSLGWDFASNRYEEFAGVKYETVESLNDNPDTAYVKSIDISGYGFAFELPMLSFSRLSKLDISDNYIYGDLYTIDTPFIDTLSANNNSFSFLIDSISALFESGGIGPHYLNISENNIVGEFQEVKINSNLKHIDVSGNQIQGLVTPDQLDSLEYIDISGNELQAYYQPILPTHRYIDISNNSIYNFFPDIVDADSLEVLDISNNRFYSLPDITSSTLRNLNLRSNIFSGVIPSIIITSDQQTDIRMSNNQFSSGYGNINIKTLGTLDLSFNNIDSLNEDIIFPNGRVFMRNNFIETLDLDEINIDSRVIYLSDNLIDTIILSDTNQNPPIIQLRGNRLDFEQLSKLPLSNYETFEGGYSPQNYSPEIIFDKESNLLFTTYKTTNSNRVEWAFGNGIKAEGDSVQLLDLGEVILTITDTRFPDLSLRNTIIIPAEPIKAELDQLKEIALNFNYHSWHNNQGWAEIVNDQDIDLDSIYGVRFTNKQISTGQISSVINSIDLSWNNLNNSNTDGYKISLPYLEKLDLSHNSIESIDTIFAPLADTILIKDNSLTDMPSIYANWDDTDLYIDLSINRFSFEEVERFDAIYGDSTATGDVKYSPQYPIVGIERNGNILSVKDTAENVMYNWYLNDTLVGKGQHYVAVEQGYYYAVVSHEVFPWTYRTDRYYFGSTGIESLHLVSYPETQIKNVFTLSGRQIPIMEGKTIQELNEILPNGFYIALTSNNKTIKISISN